MYYAYIYRRKSGIAILTSDTVNFGVKKTTIGTLRNYMTVNLPRRYSNPKCIYTKQQNWKTNQAKTGITERRNREINDYCWRHQHSFLNNC